MSAIKVSRNKITYSEKQRFRQWWIWILVLISPASLLWVILKQGTLDIYLIALTFILGLAISLFVYTTGLDTEVNENGVYIRFRPFHRKWRSFEFATIQKVEAISYNPIRDYGGWGIRYGRKGKGKAYNVSGNKGVLLTIRDGAKVLIGSRDAKILAQTINRNFMATNNTSL